jgi:hypothetical protein
MNFTQNIYIFARPNLAQDIVLRVEVRTTSKQVGGIVRGWKSINISRRGEEVILQADETAIKTEKTLL